MAKRTLKLSPAMLARNPHLAEEMVLNSQPRPAKRKPSDHSPAEKNRRLKGARRGRFIESCMFKEGE